MEIYLRAEGGPGLNGVQKARVLIVGPGIAEGEVVFILSCKRMRESPLHFVVVDALGRSGVTTLAKLTRCDTLRQRQFPSSRKTGASPSCSSRACVSQPLPCFACSLSGNASCCPVPLLALRSRTSRDIRCGGGLPPPRSRTA